MSSTTGSDGLRRAGTEPHLPTADLLELVLSTQTVEEYLHEVAVLAANLDPGIGGCGVTVGRNGSAFSVATSNEFAAAVDEVQYGLDMGPCLESLGTGEVVVVDDMLEDERWDGYPAHALSHGVRSSLSVPLGVGGRTIGALNAYGTETHLFTGALRARLLDFGAQAEVAIALALRHAEQNELMDQLHTAMQSRSIIDQALGVLMARQRCTAAEAFAILRSASQSRNRKIAAIAAEIITVTTGTEPQAGRFDA
jgi:GAF domain-containing protein